MDASQPGRPTPSEAFEAVLRWERSGGHWCVVARTAEQVEISLQTCDAREEMARIRSGDVDLLAFVQERDSSEDPPH